MHIIQAYEIFELSDRNAHATPHPWHPHFTFNIFAVSPTPFSFSSPTHLVLDDCNALPVILGQDAVEQRCLARAKETRDDLDGTRPVSALDPCPTLRQAAARSTMIQVLMF